MTDLSIVIVSFNTKDLLSACIKSVKKHTGSLDYEIIVVDNASKDGSASMAEKLGTKVIRNDKNIGFGGGNNQGMKLAIGRYILLLNSDTRIDGDVLDKMVLWMDKNPNVGIASCGLKNADGSFQGTGGYFPHLARVFAWMTFLDDLPGVSRLIKSYHPMHGRSPLGGNSNFFRKRRAMDWLTGAFLMIRREVMEAVGYFDKDYFMYVEEVDYCFRARKLGWEVWYLPNFSIIHYGGASANPEFSLLNEVKGLKTFYKKHKPAWQYFFLILFLKLGMFLRIFVFGKTYAKIFVSV